MALSNELNLLEKRRQLCQMREQSYISKPSKFVLRRAYSMGFESIRIVEYVV